MTSDRTIEAAFALLSLMVGRVKRGCPEYYGLLGMVGALGWVLERGGHVENMEMILRDARASLKLPASDSGG